MLIKLRNRLLLLMTGFSGIVLITAFIAIYAISHFKAISDINHKLNFNEMLEVYTDGNISIGAEKINAIVVNRIFPNLGVYFNLIVNENGEIMVIDSALELPLEAYEMAGHDAWENPEGQTLRFENRLWRYKITPATTRLIIDRETSDNYSGKTYQIRFLDVTETAESLKTLRNILLLMSIILLVIFFFMSLYFANHTIKPMKDVWENQQQFLADASHELKTPLSIITTNISVLYANKEDTIQEQLKWLDYISNGARRMSGLVQSMLTLSKIESENTPVCKSLVNISDLLSDIVNLFEVALNNKSITLTRHAADGLSINTDPSLAEQVIHIMIENAVRYTPSYGVINIALYSEKSNAILKIENSGPGIPQEDLPKIFDRFFRSDSSRANSGDGYGLGLSIAKSVIDKMGGKIEVKSIENQKTTFTLKIPL